MNVAQRSKERKKEKVLELTSEILGFLVELMVSRAVGVLECSLWPGFLRALLLRSEGKCFNQAHQVL